MKIQSVFDPAFAAYGQVLTSFDTASLVEALKTTAIPEGVAYVPSEPVLECLPAFEDLQVRAMGGMPLQLGWCNGYNTKLNCLEYHRNSELNLGATDFILLLGKQENIVNDVLDTATVEAFLCPAGTLIEVFATALHYAPCSATKGAAFQVMVGLPLGTNFARPAFDAKTAEDARLTARNKWLLAHADSSEAAGGCPVGLSGENIDIADLI